MQAVMRPIRFFLCAMALTACAGEELRPAESISLASAKLDDQLPDSVRHEFADDDGRPLRSVSVDLGNTARAEKIVPNEYLCGNGGCPWVIYDVEGQRTIGRIFGSTIWILKEKTNGYHVLRADYTMGAGVPESRIYSFHDGAYEPSK